MGMRSTFNNSAIGFWKSITWSIKFGFCKEPLLFLLFVLLIIIDSAFPAIQVTLINQLPTALSQNSGNTTFMVIFLALTVGMSRALSDIVLTTSNILSRKLTSAIRTKLLHRIAALKPREVLYSDIASQTRQLRDKASDIGQHSVYVINSLRAILTLSTIAVSLLQINTIATVLIVLASLPTIFAFTQTSKLEAKQWPTIGKETKIANYHADLLSYERSALELSALGTANKVAHVGAAHYHSIAKLYARMLLIGSAWISGAAALSTLLLTGALLSVLWNSAGVGGIAAGILALLSGMNATSDAGYTFGSVISGVPAIQEFLKFNSAANAPYRHSNPDEINKDITGIELCNISYQYPNASHNALTDVSLRAERGEMVAIVGANGAGKTTAVRILLGMLSANAGEVHTFGAPPDIDDNSIFGLLTQSFEHYEFTVRESLSLAAHKEFSDAQMWEALKFARIDDLVRSWDNGLDTQLGDQFGGVGLSGGQWQRLALARIFLRNSPIWVLDEPTSAVDAETEQEIFEELGKDRTNRTTIVISHRAWTLKNMDRIYVIDGGKLVEQGTYSELLQAKGRFSEMFQNQSV